MKAKEFLNQYKRLTNEIEHLSEDIEQIVSTIGAIGQNEEGPRGSTPGDPTGSLAVKLADLKMKKESLLGIAWVRREEIVDVISQVEDKDQNGLLYARYIKCMSWREVADEIKRSEVYVRGSLHNDALHSVMMILERS